MTTQREQPDRDAVLQEIIDRLAGPHVGGDPEQIAGVIEREMSAAGLGTGATKWIRDTADAIADGRILVADSSQPRHQPDAPQAPPTT